MRASHLRPGRVVRFAAAAGLCAVLAVIGTVPAHSQAPRVPFSGIYGATAGAGAVLVWDRSGGGENPARLGPPGGTVSLAGYAPFGLEGARAAEASVAWDHARWGTSVSYRGLFLDNGEGEATSAGIGFTLQISMKPRQGWILGISGGRHEEPGSAANTASMGLLWRPRPWGSVGAFADAEEASGGTGKVIARAGAGVEGGSQYRGIAWRLCLEGLYADSPRRQVLEPRFAAGLQLHPLLSLYAGADPVRQTAALGIRFGMGNWEAFSAMRRHARLGGTSLQALRWHFADSRARNPKQ